MATLEVSFGGCQGVSCEEGFPRAFVFSRWATIGSSARVSVVGVATGFLHLHKFMLDRGLVSAYETTSAQKLQESLMIMLLRDPRMLMQVSALHDCMLEEMSALQRLSQCVWEFLGRILSERGSRLKDAVL
eukprot:6492283-Amphidinium_carterae.1